MAVGAAYVLGRRDWEEGVSPLRNASNLQLWLALILAHVPPFVRRIRWKKQGARVNQQSVAILIFPCCHTHVEHDHGDCCCLCVVLTGCDGAVALQEDLKVVAGVVEASILGLQARTTDHQHTTNLHHQKVTQNKDSTALANASTPAAIQGRSGCS